MGGNQTNEDDGWGFLEDNWPELFKRIKVSKGQKRRERGEEGCSGSEETEKEQKVRCDSAPDRVMGVRVRGSHVGQWSKFEYKVHTGLSFRFVVQFSRLSKWYGAHVR